jgi:hypothetical protein
MAGEKSISFTKGGTIDLTRLENWSQVGQSTKYSGRYYLHVKKDKSGSYTASVKYLNWLQRFCRWMFGSYSGTHIKKIADNFKKDNVRIQVNDEKNISEPINKLKQKVQEIGGTLQLVINKPSEQPPPPVSVRPGQTTTHVQQTHEPKKGGGVEGLPPQTGGQTTAVSQPVVPPTAPRQPSAQPAVVSQPTTVQGVAKPTQVSPVRRTLEENRKKLETEFEKGIFIRTFSNYKGEVEKTIKDKKKAELDPGHVEARTWASTSVIQKDCPCEVWTAGGQDRCGLLLSSETQLGGFNVVDMTTENVPDTVKNPQERLGYFPQNMPKFPLAQLMGLVNDVSEKGKQLVRTLLKLKDDTVTITDGMRTQAEKCLERQDLIPQEYHTVYTMEEVTSKMENIKKERKANPQLGPAPYGEAKVRYMPKDILGIYVQDTPQSKERGAELQKLLKDEGILVPIFSYNPTKGQLIPESTPENKTV